MIETINLAFVNCFLISDGKNSLLIDTGVKKNGPEILEKVKDRNVRLIVLTHAHQDHLGSAAFLASELGVRIAMSKGDELLLTEPHARKLTGHTAVGKTLAGASGKTLENGKPQDFKPIFLNDGDTLSEYGLDARIISLPGHTEGSIGILFENSIIVGDAMFNILKPTGARIYENRTVMEESLKLIQNTNARTAYVGHGKEIDLASFFRKQK